MRFAGIDVASKTHVVAVVDDAGDIVVRATPFTEDVAGYARLFGLLKDPTDILVALEATGHYGRNLLRALAHKGFTITLINPVRTRRFAEEDLARAKNDSIDALRIARFAAQKRPAPTPPPDDATDDLRQLIWFHDRLTQDFGDRLRQLHRLVALCFPEFTRHVRGLDSHRAIRILYEYPTAPAFDQASVPQLAQLRYGERHLVGAKLARALLEAAKLSVAGHDGDPYRHAVQYVCLDMARLRQSLDDISVDLASRVRQHPIAALLTTIPGLGFVSAARIMAALGDPARFRHGAALASYAGLVPKTNQSGLYRPPRGTLSPMGSARLRRALYMATLAGVRVNPWLRAFYQRLRAKGKLPKVALVAAERKLLMAVYSVAKNRQPFVARLIGPSQ